MRATWPDSSVLIIEDHVLFAQSLEIVLKMEGYDVSRLDMPDIGGSMATLRSRALRAKARTALVDLDLGRFGDGTSLLAPLSQSGTNVVVLTASADRGRWGECLHEGARKVISKAASLEDIVDTVRRLDRGLSVTSRVERQSLLESWRSHRMVTDDMRRRLELLSPREREVLAALAEGHNVGEIARMDVVSEATVRTQVKAILAKLEVSSQLAAVTLAHHVNWQHTA